MSYTPMAPADFIPDTRRKIAASVRETSSFSRGNRYAIPTAPGIDLRPTYGDTSPAGYYGLRKKDDAPYTGPRRKAQRKGAGYGPTCPACGLCRTARTNLCGCNGG